MYVSSNLKFIFIILLSGQKKLERIVLKQEMFCFNLNMNLDSFSQLFLFGRFTNNREPVGCPITSQPFLPA